MYMYDIFLLLIDRLGLFFFFFLLIFFFFLFFFFLFLFLSSKTRPFLHGCMAARVQNAAIPFHGWMDG